MVLNGPFNPLKHAWLGITRVCGLQWLWRRLEQPADRYVGRCTNVKRDVQVFRWQHDCNNAAEASIDQRKEYV